MSFWQSVRSFFFSPVVSGDGYVEDGERSYREPGPEETLSEWVERMILEAARQPDYKLEIQFSRRRRRLTAFVYCCDRPSCKKPTSTYACSDWQTFEAAMRECSSRYAYPPTQFPNARQKMIWSGKPEKSIRAFFMVEHPREGQGAQALGRLLDDCCCDHCCCGH